MYLQIGQSVVIRDSEIVGIFDLDNTTYNTKAAQFVNRAEKSGRLIVCTDDLPKSVILCDKTVYLSPFNSQTLQKRLENGLFESSIAED